MEPQAVPYPKAVAQFPSVRQSLASSFNDCSLATKFSTEYRSGWSFPYQARGEMFHRFAARALTWMAQVSDDGRIPVGEALEILKEVLLQQDIDRSCPNCGSMRIRKGITKRGMRYCLGCRKQFETNMIRVPLDMVEQLYWVVKKWAHDNWFATENLVAVEQKLKAHIYYPNPTGGSVGREITGTADALLIEGDYDDHATVLDWKDMWRLPPITEIGHGGYFQQRFYAYLIFVNYPTVMRVTLREFYVRFSEPREATLDRELHMEEIGNELSALIQEFDRTVEERLWNPSPGHHCGYCPAPQRCTIFPEARGSGRITSVEEASQAAAEFVVASAIVKQLREAIGPWCEMHGDVPVRDAKGLRVLGYEEVNRTTKPTPEQIEQAEREKGGPLTSKEIERMFVTRQGTKLTVHVPKPKLVTEEDDELIAALQASVAEAAAA